MKKKIYGSKKRGFACMSPEKVRRICSMGGKAIASKRGHMAKIGALGGRNSHRSRKQAPASST